MSASAVAIAAGARHATHFYDVFHVPPERDAGVRVGRKLRDDALEVVQKFSDDPQHAFPGHGQMKPEQAEALDEMLWDMGDDAYIPHQIAGAGGLEISTMTSVSAAAARSARPCNMEMPPTSSQS